MAPSVDDLLSVVERQQQEIARFQARVDELTRRLEPDACPHCGGVVAETHQDTQDQVELPARPRGRHPQPTSAATGAAASQVGPRAQALVVYLTKHAGLSHGKAADVLPRLGSARTRGARAQIVLRAGRRLRADDDAILQVLPRQEHRTPAEPGWRVGGHPVGLHAWVGADVTGFAIDPQRGAAPLTRAIGWDWDGDLTHDGFAAYDRFPSARHQQCVFHVRHRAHDLEAVPVGRAKVFRRQVLTLFQGAREVRDACHAGRLDAAARAAAHDRYGEDLLALTERRRVHAANERRAAQLYGHGSPWLTFLEEPAVPATNHRAEQALKGPSVNRTVWGGHRTAAGVEAPGVLPSALATCKQQAISFLHFLSDRLCGIPRALLGATTAEPVMAGR